MAATNKTMKEEVLREFPPLGKYRVRVVMNPRTKVKTLDIREYVQGETFEGFTRRGIRIWDKLQLELLKDILREILEPGPGLPGLF